MPQNSSKHSGKPWGASKGSTSSTATAVEETSNNWQRAQGAFSGKAKKDYLKWKRQQKAAAASTDDDSDWRPEASTGPACNTAVQDSTADGDGMQPTYAPPATAAGACPAVAMDRTWSVHTADDPCAPLQYRPLVAVPAAPFDARSVRGSPPAAAGRHPQQPSGHADAAHTVAVPAAPFDATDRSMTGAPAAAGPVARQSGHADAAHTATVSVAPFAATDRSVTGAPAAAGPVGRQSGHADAAHTVTVSAAPFAATDRSVTGAPAAAGLPPQQQPAQADSAHTVSTAATSASCTAAAVDSCGVQDDVGVMCMPVLDPAEVGFTAEGFELDMPTRPRWQGVVSSAEELHALEEQQFATWQASLLHMAQLPGPNPSDSTTEEEEEEEEVFQQQQQQSSRAGGVGKLSFYEGRLEYWRQLWRTLEMSDVVLMIVDARNPLLHFSHALYRHITRDHKSPLMILLNKCDLIPAAAAAAWQQWLQQQLPGVSVVAASAADDQAAAAAASVVKELLSVVVERGGKAVTVQDFVNMSVEQLLEASYTRNTHAKRHVVPHHTPAAAASKERHSDSDAAAAADTADDTNGSGQDHEIDDDSNDEWSLKPSKVAKKAGKKAGRKAGWGRYRQQQQQQQQQRGKLTPRAGELGSGRLAQPSAAAVIEELAAADDDELDPAASDLTARIESLTLEHRLSSSFSTRDQTAGISDATAAAAAGGLGRVTPAAAAAAAAAAAEEPDGSSSGSEGLESQDTRPVVVGLLGEPNVGKSSTLNTLLGAHRVAVSCHPGRTKHYQTHFMTDKLVLCDCPGIVFPRLGVSLPMQVLFGSYPIASCRQPYAVVRYLAEASWPRLHKKLRLKQQQQQQQDAAMATEQQTTNSGSSTQSRHLLASDTAYDVPQTQDSRNHSIDASSSNPCGSSAEDQEEWSPWQLCEALAEKRRWVLPRSGRLDTYRAANWLLRAALGGREGLGLAFMPPEAKQHELA